ncbi:hypothetical protein [Listeria floridensis]|nr:hypothetical protein [Listeria floridensis]
MSLREFEYIRNGYALTSSDKIFFDFVNAKNSIGMLNDKKLSKEIHLYLKENPSDFIPYCLSVIEDVYTKVTAANSYDIDSPEAVKIWEELDARSGWTYQELFIMSKLFLVFPPEISENIIERIEKEMDNYLEFFEDIHFDATFYMNLGKYYAIKRHYSKAKIYLEKVIPLTEKYRNMVTVENDAYAYLAIVDYMNGNKEAADEVEYCINCYHYMRRPELADDLKSDWESFFKDTYVLNG